MKRTYNLKDIDTRNNQNKNETKKATKKKRRT